MSISAFFYDNKTGEFLHGLEWTKDNVRFTNYHFRTIKMTMEEVLNYSQDFHCDITVNGHLLMILDCITFWDVICMSIKNTVNDSIYRKTYFANDWIVYPHILDKMKAGEI